MASCKTIEIGGKIYSLSLPMSKVEMAEDLLGKSLLNVFNPSKRTNSEDLELPKLSELVKIFYIELLDKHPDIDLEKAYNIIDEYLQEGNNAFSLYTLVGKAANFFKETPSTQEIVKKAMEQKKEASKK